MLEWLNFLSTGKSLSDALIFASTNPQYVWEQIVHWNTNSIHERSKLRTWGEHVVGLNRTSRLDSGLPVSFLPGLQTLKSKKFLKRGSLLGNEEPDIGGDSLNFEITYWYFQRMLHLWFREASQNLSSFRELFFHSFQGGTKGKMLKNSHNYTLVFQHFSFGPPLETMKKKVV